MGSSQNKIQHPTYNPDNTKSTTIDVPFITDDSCELNEVRSFYDWELLNTNVPWTASKFREELVPWNDDKKKLQNKLYSIYKGYLTIRLRELKKNKDFILDKDADRIRDLFYQAYKKCDPKLMLEAYSINQSFCKFLNNDMARIVLHDIYHGCSKFSCDTLYTTQDGTKSIANILSHHPEFQTYEGTVYRGMVLPIDLGHMQVNHCIMTKTFLSTSKNRHAAEMFAGYDRSDDTLDSTDETITSILCTYIVKNINGKRRALDMSCISTIKDEEEVLLLPYSIFLITKHEFIDVGNSNRKRIEIEFEECDNEQLKLSLNEQ